MEGLARFSRFIRMQKRSAQEVFTALHSRIHTAQVSMEASIHNSRHTLTRVADATSQLLSDTRDSSRAQQVRRTVANISTRIRDTVDERIPHLSQVARRLRDELFRNLHVQNETLRVRWSSLRSSLLANHDASSSPPSPDLWELLEDDERKAIVMSRVKIREDKLKRHYDTIIDTIMLDETLTEQQRNETAAYLRQQRNSDVGQLLTEEQYDSCFCPITQSLMVDPVDTCDGQTYEREAIEKWLEDHDTSPLTNLALESKVLTPNISVHNQLQHVADVVYLDA